MPQRGIDTSIWNHPDFQSVTLEARYLFLYLLTTPRGNQAGLFYLSLKSIHDDTGIPMDKILSLMDELHILDIVYYEKKQMVWIKNYLRHQAHSPKYLVAVAKCLKQVHNQNIVAEYLKYNDTVSIPYRYPIDTVSIPYGYPIDTLSIPSARRSGSGTGSGTGSESGSEEKSEVEGAVRKELGKGLGEGEEPNPLTAAALEQKSKENAKNNYKLWEECSGNLLTERIIQFIDTWDKEYSPEWVRDAIQEAHDTNPLKVVPRYVEAILKRWKADGKKKKRYKTLVTRSALPIEYTDPETLFKESHDG